MPNLRRTKPLGGFMRPQQVVRSKRLQRLRKVHDHAVLRRNPQSMRRSQKSLWNQGILTVMRTKDLDEFGIP
jgi:hypothetical protein